MVTSRGLAVSLLAAAALVIALVPTDSHASGFPFGFNPTVKPFIDQCVSLNMLQCRLNKACTWTTTRMPQCILATRINVRPPDFWRSEAVDLVTKFFTFHYGMHLVEGKTDRRYYNTEVNECAALCLKSAGGLSDWMAESPTGSNSSVSRRPCRSFDFFPFEMPMMLPPYSESTSRGICVLNVENRVTARLRPEDSSFTDAELFYISQPLLRPFSKLDGYYEVTGVRGEGMSGLLDFGISSSSNGEQGPVWGQARYGISFLQEPTHRTGDLDCSDISGSSRVDDLDSAKVFFGGFTPTNRDNNCPGLVSKAAAASMCKDSGGDLCPTQSVIRQLDGNKLGCNFDGQSMWANEDEETNPNLKKYVRCCASFVDPPDCWLYSKSNVDFCSSKSTSNDCIGYGSGYVDQLEKGYGKLLDDYRARCNSAITLGVISSCRQLLMRPWQSRDRCVWCTSGNNNVGQCRPGNNFGVCQVANTDLKEFFAYKLGSYCPQSQLCDMVNRKGFQDLLPLFQKASGSTSSPSSSSSPRPTTRPPNQSLPTTWAPTTPSGSGPIICLLTCRQIRGVNARSRCKNRADCIWNRGRGTMFPNCKSR